MFICIFHNEIILLFYNILFLLLFLTIEFEEDWEGCSFFGRKYPAFPNVKNGIVSNFISEKWNVDSWRQIYINICPDQITEHIVSILRRS